MKRQEVCNLEWLRGNRPLASAEEFPQRQAWKLQSLCRDASVCAHLGAKNVSELTPQGNPTRPPLCSQRVRSSTFSPSEAALPKAEDGGPTRSSGLQGAAPTWPHCALTGGPFLKQGQIVHLISCCPHSSLPPVPVWLTSQM